MGYKYKITYGGRAQGKTHALKMQGFKATTNLPGFENCRVLVIDNENKVWGLPVTQNQLLVKRLKRAGRKLSK